MINGIDGQTNNQGTNTKIQINFNNQYPKL